MSRIDFSHKASPESDDDREKQIADGTWSWAYEKACDETRRIISEYLQSDSTLSLDEAVDQVALLYDDKFGPENSVHDIIIEMPERIPYDHPGNKKLADFITAFCESDKWPHSSHWETREKALDAFYSNLADVFYSDSGKPPDEWAKEEWGGDPMMYANMQAFLAELRWKRPDDPFAYNWARYALRRALEDDRSTCKPRYRDAYVIGAAQWILRQAPTIYTESLTVPNIDRNAVSKVLREWFSRLRGRPDKVRIGNGEWINSLNDIKRPNGQQQYFSMELWQIWRDRFKEIAADESYGKTCRIIAERAADIMALQENPGPNVDTGHSEEKTQISANAAAATP